MTNKILDSLIKSDNEIVKISDESSKFEDKKQKIIEIIATLKNQSRQYSPQETTKLIIEYISVGNRILYSELTNSIYMMSPEERGTVATNLDKLLNFTTNKDNNISDAINNIVVKFYDHFNLACHQIDNTKNILAANIEETKNDVYQQLYDKFKGMEKEYITILGIFSSVILAFIGGITFSTSVLKNINQVGIYRLTFVILLLGFILLNTINILLIYIFKLNNVDGVKIKIWPINIIILTLIGLVIATWIFNVHNIPSYMSQWFPW